MSRNELEFHRPDQRANGEIQCKMTTLIIGGYKLERREWWNYRTIAQQSMWHW